MRALEPLLAHLDVAAVPAHRIEPQRAAQHVAQAEQQPAHHGQPARPVLRQVHAGPRRRHAQREDHDAERPRRLGVRPAIRLHQQRLEEAPRVDRAEAQLQQAAQFRARMGNRSILLCASTREGEEALILDAWQATVSAGDTTLLVIVPRHPQRFDEVARLVESRGLKLQRRADDTPIAPATQVWLGDSMGEMFAYYAASDVAFVGGSLLDFGCQNLIEPCAVGVPVLVGPSTFNFAEAARAAIAAGAACQVGTVTALVEEAQTLLADKAARLRMGDAGRSFAAQHRGATQRTLKLLERFIPTGR